MATVSVLTPLYRPEVSYLEDSYRDLQEQEVDWEWIIHWDGPATCPLPDDLLRDQRVKVIAGEKHWGIAITRNRALMNSSGEIIHAHDYDDRLQPGAFQAALDAFQAHREIAYTCGQWDDLIQANDGSWQVKEYPDGGLRPGLLHPGWADLCQIDEDGRRICPPPGSYSLRRIYVVAYGGWGALSSGEDSLLIETIRSFHPGFYLPGCLGQYRKHGHNITQTRSEQSLYEQHRDFVQSRIDALFAINSDNTSSRS